MATRNTEPNPIPAVRPPIVPAMAMPSKGVLPTRPPSADKRIHWVARLALYLRQRARHRAQARSDAALRALARDDPRIQVDLRMVMDKAAAYAEPAAPAQTVATAAAVRATGSRGFRAAPMPGMPQHLQYLPG